MEQTYTVYRYREAPRPRITLTRPALVLLVVLVSLGGWTFLHHPATSSAAQKQQVHLRPRSATAVLVLNGNGKAGSASDMSTRLLTRGYRSAFANDAQVMTYGRSLVLFRKGWAGEARRLAKDAGIRAFAPLDGRSTRYPLVAIVGQ